MIWTYWHPILLGFEHRSFGPYYGVWPYSYAFLVQNPEGKRPLGIPKSKWDYNVKKNPNKKNGGGGGEGGGRTWTGFMWLREGTGGGLL
jgi:hypothetical protein